MWKFALKSVPLYEKQPNVQIFIQKLFKKKLY